MNNLSRLLFITTITFMTNGSQAQSPNSKFDTLKDNHLSDHAAHEREEKKELESRLKKLIGAPRYSCDLRNSYSQCREYPVDKVLSEKLADLKESCETLPKAIFKKETCPKIALAAKCQHIQLNNHDKNTFIYDNHYYFTGGEPWNKADIKRVCTDLKGGLVLN